MPHIIPTVHPAIVLHQAKPITDVIASDLAKGYRISQEGPSLEEYIIYIIPGNPIGIDRAYYAGLAWLNYWNASGAAVAIDVETSGLEYFNCKLYSIAIACAEDKVAVSFTLDDFHTLPRIYEQGLKQAVCTLLANPKVGKIYHNAPFDKAVLTFKGYQINGPTWDTMAIHHIIQPDIPHDLGWVGHTYLDVSPWKLDHQSGKMANTRDPVKLLIYNAKDALYTAMCLPLEIVDVHKRGMTDNLVGWQMAFTDLATDMEIQGIPINYEMRRAMGREILKNLFKLKRELREFLSWPNFNPMSQAHRIEAIYGKKYKEAPYNLGLIPNRFTKKSRAPSTSYKAIIDNLEHPFIHALVEYIENRHTYSTIYKEVYEDTDEEDDSSNEELEEVGKEKPGAYQRAIRLDTKRLHPKWNPVGQVGSRYSSSPNCQNVKEKHRIWMEAPPGRVFVAADKSQLELRIIAVRCGVKDLLIEMEKPDGDPHTMNAAIVYGEAFHQRTKAEQKNLRAITKNVMYAGIYLAGVETVWRTCRENKRIDARLRAAMTLPVVRHVHSSIFGHYVEIPKWHEANMRSIMKCGYLEVPPFNRRRYYPVLPPPMTEVANFPIQTCGSDYVGMEMCQIQEELKRKYHGTASIILHGHDAVYVECNERDAEDIKVLVDKLFGNTFVDGPGGPVHLTAEAKIGKNLLEVK